MPAENGAPMHTTKPRKRRSAFFPHSPSPSRPSLLVPLCVFSFFKHERPSILFFSADRLDHRVLLTSENSLDKEGPRGTERQATEGEEDVEKRKQRIEVILGVPRGSRTSLSCQPSFLTRDIKPRFSRGCAGWACEGRAVHAARILTNCRLTLARSTEPGMRGSFARRSHCDRSIPRGIFRVKWFLFVARPLSFFLWPI